jgi:hypothetical protein
LPSLARGFAHLRAARALHSSLAMRSLRTLAPLLLLALTACITHLPPRSTTHLQIHWEPSFEAAAAHAAATGKPLLAVLAAGERDGLC